MDFSEAWYGDVGLTLTLTMLINIVTLIIGNYATPAIAWVRRLRVVRRLGGRKVDQELLNDLAAGTHFKLDGRCAPSLPCVNCC